MAFRHCAPQASGQSANATPQILPLCDEIVSAQTHSGTTVADALLPLAYREAITNLPEGMREAFVLVAQHGFTHKEAAQILALPEGTVKWRVAEAARRLRVALVDFVPASTHPKETSL